MSIPYSQALFDHIIQHGSITGVDPLKGFGYHFDFSVPAIATAIHAGHGVRKELHPYMALSDRQRLFEEDTGTDFMIQGFPNAIWGLESRAVYDLNRDEDMALPLTPEKFWGTTVYSAQPTHEMNKRSLDSHQRFYLFLGTVIKQMIDLHGICMVYDIHSYNISRQVEKGFDPPPVFNLGTAALDRSRWSAEIDGWIHQLENISLPGIETRVAENEVFSGKGEMCKRLVQWHPKILVLPTEVSKVYMDERVGAVFPDIIKAIGKGLVQSMMAHCQG